MNTRHAMLVLFVAIPASLLCSDCRDELYHCYCRDGTDVVEIDSHVPCDQTPGCIPGPRP